LPHCPTYHKTQSEADSPRGRILLTQAIAQGVLPVNDKYMAHMDLCLTCRACERACPNQVEYGKIADHARALISTHRPAKWRERLALYLVGNKTLLRLSGVMLRIATVTGLNRLLPVLPAAPAQQYWKPVYPVSNARGEVQLFLGCASSVLEADTLAASIFVLNQLGYTVRVPRQQTCCGGLHAQAGHSTGQLNRQNQAAFGASELPILSVASGCGSRLHELLPGRTVDIAAFLVQADGWDTVTLAPLAARIAVHEPCSLRNVLRSEASLYQLLQRIPGAEVLALPGNAQCCGGAGAYSLTQPEMAGKLRDDKIGLIEKTSADYLVTSNIGCALHIAGGLKNQQTVIIHPVMLLARQMGYTP
jgi:glycolate oxidase iron-sulfur subunit